VYDDIRGLGKGRLLSYLVEGQEHQG
jgi:hypothetical protein